MVVVFGFGVLLLRPTFTFILIMSTFLHYASDIATVVSEFFAATPVPDALRNAYTYWKQQHPGPMLTDGNQQPRKWLNVCW